MDSSRTADVSSVRFTPEEFREWLEDIEREVLDGAEESLREDLESRIAAALEEIDADVVYQRDQTGAAAAAHERARERAAIAVGYRRDTLRTSWTVVMKDGETLGGSGVEALIELDLQNSVSISVTFKGLESRSVNVSFARRSKPRLSASSNSSEWVRRMNGNAKRILRERRPWWWALHLSWFGFIVGSLGIVAGSIVLLVSTYGTSTNSMRDPWVAAWTWGAMFVALVAAAVFVVAVTTSQYRVGSRAAPRERVWTAARWIVLTVIAGAIGALISRWWFGS